VRWPWSKPAPEGPHRCEATDRLNTITDMALGRQATGHATVGVGELLDMADPGHEKREARHPLADPVTGAMPVDPKAYEEKGKGADQEAGEDPAP
jgi:hypothetical protein